MKWEVIIYILRSLFISLLLLLCWQQSFRLLAMEANSFRYFISQTIEIAGQSDPKSRASQFRSLLKAQHPLITYVSQGNSLSKLWQEAHLPPLPQELKSAFALNELFSNTPLGSLRSRIMEGVARVLGPNNLNRTIDLIPGPLIGTFLNKVNQSLETTTLSYEQVMEFLQVKVLADHLTRDLPEIQNILARMTVEKMKKMPLHEKREFITKYMNLKSTASYEQRLILIAEHAGPLAQSLFRVIGHTGAIPHMRQVSKQLEQRVSVTSSEKVEALQMIEKSLHSQGGINSIFKEGISYLSAGIFNLTFEGILKSTGETVAIKVNRPGIKQRFAQDFELAHLFIDHPAIQTQLEMTEELFNKELDLKKEAEQLNRAAEYFKKDVPITVPSVKQDMPSNREVLFMSKAKGTLYAEMKVKDRGAVKRLAQIWLTRALFGDGNFNGSLHAGNLYLDYNDSYPEGFRWTILDYGDTASFSKHQQAELIKLMMAVSFKDLKQVKNSLTVLLPETGMDALFPELARFIQPQAEQNFKESIELFSKALLKHRLEVPPELFSFLRSFVFMEGMLNTGKGDLRKSEMIPILTKVLLKQGALKNGSGFWRSFSSCVGLKLKSAF